MKNCAHLKWTVAVVTALFAVAAVAHAQVPGPGAGQGFRLTGDSPNDPSSLLASESVQMELGLTDDQKASLQKLRNDRTAGGQAFFSQFMGLSQDEMQARLDQRAKETRDQISKILAPKQMGRLAEINIQVAGPIALNFDDVAEKIGLTAAQKEQLKNLGDEARGKAAELNSNYNTQPSTAQKRQELQQKLKEIASDRKEKAMSLLTDDQKAEFKRLQGPEFDTSTVQPARASFKGGGRNVGPNGITPPNQQPGA